MVLSRDTDYHLSQSKSRQHWYFIPEVRRHCLSNQILRFFITFSSFCSFLRQMHLPAMRFTEIEINEKWIRNYDNKNLFCIQDILYAQYFNTFKVTMFKIKIEIQIETESNRIAHEWAGIELEIRKMHHCNAFRCFLSYLYLYSSWEFFVLHSTLYDFRSISFCFSLSACMSACLLSLLISLA